MAEYLDIPQNGRRLGQKTTHILKINSKITDLFEFSGQNGMLRGRNNRFLSGRLQNNTDRQFSDRDQCIHSKTSNVRHYVCSICSVPGHYKQCCHIAVYQYQALTAVFGVNMQQQTNTKLNTAEAQQLVTEQNDDNVQDSLYF